MQPKATWSFWPRVADVTAEYDAGGTWSLAFVELAFGALFFIPSVSRATGISPKVSVGLVLLHILCFKFTGTWLYRAASRGNQSAKRFMVAFAMAYNYGIAVAFVLATGDPRTMLWMSLLIMAAVHGASQEIEPSLVLLLACVLIPVCTIPLYLSRGFDLSAALAGPLVCAGLSASVYMALAGSANRWRAVRAAQAEEIARLRALSAQLERQHIAQDLHDVVGSTLATVALYADLVERHVTDPSKLLRIAATVREAAREGIGDLRGVLDALSPLSTELEAVAENLRHSGARAAEASQAEIVVTCAGTSVKVEGPIRIAIMRTFQEAVHNAVRHGKARRITAHLTSSARDVSLHLSDNGTGFDMAESAPLGRGLSGMRTRAKDLGGRFELTTAPGHGVRICLALPRD